MRGSQHVYIRPMQLYDAPAMLELRLKNRAFLSPFEPIASRNHYTLEGQERIVRSLISNWEDDQGYGFGIFLYGTDQLIGRVNLSNVSRGAWQNCTIGYFVDEGMQGRGYVTGAVRLAIEFAFEEIELHRVEAGVMPSNIGSIRVLEKVGFTKIGLSERHLKINGRWEDHLLYSLVSEGWKV